MKKIVLAAAVSAALSPAAFAADPMTIVITASRYEQNLEEVASNTTVIEKEEIQESSDLNELLSKQAGVAIASNGFMGKNSSIFMRGTNSDHTIVLVDGVKLNSATTGSAPIQYIDPSNIERIEIVRGPKSALYGANAIGGVINIITKKDALGEGYSVKASRGSFNTQSQSASAFMNSEKGKLNLSVSRLRSDGIDAQDNDDHDESDKDGYTNQTFSGNISLNLSAQSSLEISSFNSTGMTEYDGSYVNETLYELNTAAAKYNYRLDNITLSMKVSQLTNRSTSYKDKSSKSEYITNRKEISPSLLFDNQKLIVLAGAELSTEEYSGHSSSSFEKPLRENDGYFIAPEYQVNSLLSIGGSYRRDKSNAYGTNNTKGAEVTLSPFTNNIISLSYKEGFKAPTFNDTTNSSIKPEKSEAIELSNRYSSENITVTTTVYKQKVTDLIDWYEKPDGNWDTRNIDAEIQGLEAGFEHQLKTFNWHLNATYLEALNTAIDDQLDRRPEFTATLGASKQFGKTTISSDIQHVGERNDNDGAIKLDAYQLVNLKAQTNVTKSFIISAKLNNIFDKEYELADGYNQPGFNAMLEAEMRL